MPEYYGSSRSDGKDPGEEFKKFRQENPKEKEARKEMKSEGIISTQKKSKEMVWQELTAIKQEYKETFSEEESEEYFKKLHAKRLEYKNLK